MIHPATRRCCKCTAENRLHKQEQEQEQAGAGMHKYQTGARHDHLTGSELLPWDIANKATAASTIEPTSTAALHRYTKASLLAEPTLQNTKFVPSNHTRATEK